MTIEELQYQELYVQCSGASASLGKFFCFGFCWTEKNQNLNRAFEVFFKKIVMALKSRHLSLLETTVIGTFYSAFVNRLPKGLLIFVVQLKKNGRNHATVTYANHVPVRINLQARITTEILWFIMRVLVRIPKTHTPKHKYFSQTFNLIV